MPEEGRGSSELLHMHRQHHQNQVEGKLETSNKGTPGYTSNHPIEAMIERQDEMLLSLRNYLRECHAHKRHLRAPQVYTYLKNRTYCIFGSTCFCIFISSLLQNQNSRMSSSVFELCRDFSGATNSWLGTARERFLWPRRSVSCGFGRSTRIFVGRIEDKSTRDRSSLQTRVMSTCIIIWKARCSTRTIRKTLCPEEISWDVACVSQRVLGKYSLEHCWYELIWESIHQFFRQSNSYASEFVDSALLVFQAQKNTGDYHGNFDEELYTK